MKLVRNYGYIYLATLIVVAAIFLIYFHSQLDSSNPRKTLLEVLTYSLVLLMGILQINKPKFFNSEGSVIGSKFMGRLLVLVGISRLFWIFKDRF